MSEAELHIMRGRLDAGRWNKAQRGELFSHPPIGYIRSATTGRWELDPDEQVQHVVRLVFEKFEELGSAVAVLGYLVKNKIRLGVRPHGGPNRGALEWRRPGISTLTHMLHNPTYAGAYSYGRHPTDPRRKRPGRRGSGKVTVPMEQWRVLRLNELPAYITWEQYLANHERLANNRTLPSALGAPRDGACLLGGLVVCGRCGYRMSVNYNGDGRFSQYVCKQARSRYGEAACQSLASRFLDDLVGQQVLLALQPAALELSLQARQDVQRERDRLHKHWHQRLQRVKQEAERAFRQYSAVEPENRLVARELERRWEQALLDQRRTQDEYDRFVQDEPPQLSHEEIASVRSLAQDIPSLWSSAKTTCAERKEIIRCLVDRVVVSIHGETEVVDVRIQWAGDFTSQHRIRRSVHRYDQLSDYTPLLTRIGELRNSLCTAAQIADRLSREGFLPPKRCPNFSAESVRQLWSRCKAFTYEGRLGENEWWLKNLCQELHVPQPTMHEWRRNGWLRARRLKGPLGRWILWADDDELNRLRRLRVHSRKRLNEFYPKELTTPKPRTSE